MPLAKKAVLVVALVLLASCGDMSPLSSGALQGEVVATPADWSLIRDAEVIQFETNPAEPYSVNLWVIEMDNKLYVHAGANKATWVEHMEQDPNVRLGYEGKIYLLTASRVSDQASFDRLSEIYNDKYGNYPRNMDINEAYLFELVPREG